MPLGGVGVGADGGFLEGAMMRVQSQLPDANAQNVANTIYALR